MRTDDIIMRDENRLRRVRLGVAAGAALQAVEAGTLPLEGALVDIPNVLAHNGTWIYKTSLESGLYAPGDYFVDVEGSVAPKTSNRKVDATTFVGRFHVHVGDATSWVQPATYTFTGPDGIVIGVPPVWADQLPQSVALESLTGSSLRVTLARAERDRNDARFELVQQWESLAMKSIRSLGQSQRMRDHILSEEELLQHAQEEMLVQFDNMAKTSRNANAGISTVLTKNVNNKIQTQMLTADGLPKEISQIAISLRNNPEWAEMTNSEVMWALTFKTALWNLANEPAWRKASQEALATEVAARLADGRAVLVAHNDDAATKAVQAAAAAAGLPKVMVIKPRFSALQVSYARVGVLSVTSLDAPLGGEGEEGSRTVGDNLMVEESGFDDVLTVLDADDFFAERGVSARGKRVWLLKHGVYHNNSGMTWSEITAQINADGTWGTPSVEELKSEYRKFRLSLRTPEALSALLGIRMVDAEVLVEKYKAENATIGEVLDAEAVDPTAEMGLEEAAAFFTARIVALGGTVPVASVTEQELRADHERDRSLLQHPAGQAIPSVDGGPESRRTQLHARHVAERVAALGIVPSQRPAATLEFDAAPEYIDGDAEFFGETTGEEAAAAAFARRRRKGLHAAPVAAPQAIPAPRVESAASLQVASEVATRRLPPILSAVQGTLFDEASEEQVAA